MKRKDKRGRILKTGEYQRSDGRYQFSKMKDGKRYTIYDRELRALREKELQLCNELLFEKKPQKNQNETEYTIDSYTEYWFQTYGNQGRKPTTLQLYRNRYHCHLKKRIGSILLGSLQKSDLQAAFSQLAEQGLKSSTLEVTKHCICNILETAVDEGHISKNPAKKLVLPKKEKNCREALSRQELKEFLDFLHKDSFYSFYEPFFQILFFTGMRIGECCAITWEDIDLEQRTIHVTKNQIRVGGKLYIGTPKSRSSFRKIPMNDIVYQCLSKMEQDKKEEASSKSFLPVLNDMGKISGEVSNFLFFSTRKKILTESTVRQMIRHITQKMNKTEGAPETKNFVPHQSRHTFTSLAYEAGVDVKYTSTILGHSSTSTTIDQYTHLSEEFNQKQNDIFRSIGT